MEFLILMFIGWIIWSAVSNAARKPPAQLPPPQQPTTTDWYTLAGSEHVRMTGPAPAAVLPARAAGEESTSELMWDELAGDRELDASGAVPADLVTLERTDIAIPAEQVAPAVVSLEQEVVDWEAEHERFHKRYVDQHSAGSAARHGLVDEMRDPGALRRAVLMAEILAPPKSLRR